MAVVVVPFELETFPQDRVGDLAGRLAGGEGMGP
jgi:hypothetical protein